MFLEQRIESMEARIAALEQGMTTRGANAAMTPLFKRYNVILSAVSAGTDIPAGEIQGRCKRNRIAWARHLFYFLLLESMDASSAELAEMAGRHRATLLNSRSVVKRRIARNTVDAALVDSLRKAIRRELGINADINQRTGRTTGVCAPDTRLQVQ